VIHDRVAFGAQPRCPFSMHDARVACVLVGGAVVVALVLTDEAPRESAGPRATTTP
jgi:hypothetical protein